MNRAARLSLASLALPLLLAACDSGALTPPPERRVELEVTGASHHRYVVSKVLVTATRIEVYSRAERRWLEVVDYAAAGRQVDLMTLQEGNPQGLGAFELPPGRYDEIRLHVLDEGAIEVDEGDGPELLPLGVRPDHRTAIEIKDRFTVSGPGLTQVELDFDVRKSIHRHHGHGHGHGPHQYSLKARIDVIDAQTSETSAVAISAARGGEVHLLGRAGLTIPPGALAQDTVIEIKPSSVSQSSITSARVFPGNVIELLPSGLTFSTPAELRLFYKPEDIPDGLTAENLSILSRSEGQLWAEHTTTTLAGAFLLSASINHFTRYVYGAEVELICPPGAAIDPDPATMRCTTTASTVRTSCAPSVDVEVKMYASDRAEVSVRQMNWESSAETIALVIPRAVSCAAREDAADCAAVAPLCRWIDDDMGNSACSADERFKTIQRVGCGTANIEASPDQGTKTTAFDVNTKDNFNVQLDLIHVLDDSDPFGEGEMYWEFAVNGILVSSQSHDDPWGVSSGHGIFLTRDPVSVGAHCEGDTVNYSGYIADNDAPEQPEWTPFGNVMLPLAAGGHNTGGEPNATFHWSVSCRP